MNSVCHQLRLKVCLATCWTWSFPTKICFTSEDRCTAPLLWTWLGHHTTTTPPRTPPPMSTPPRRDQSGGGGRHLPLSEAPRRDQSGGGTRRNRSRSRDRDVDVDGSSRAAVMSGGGRANQPVEGWGAATAATDGSGARPGAPTSPPRERAATAAADGSGARPGAPTTSRAGAEAGGAAVKAAHPTAFSFHGLAPDHASVELLSV